VTGLPRLDRIARFFHPVLPASKLRGRPVRVRLGGVAYALFRDAAGRPGALLDRCPHRFAPLSAGRVRPDGRLACPYHGWHFDRDGRGKSPSLPTLKKCDVAAMRAVERHGYVWIADPTSEDEVPAFAWDGFRFAGAFATRVDVPFHVVWDNFSEDEHTPFVHTRLGWTEADLGEVRFSTETHADRIAVHYDAPQRPSRVARVFGIRPGDRFHNDWIVRADPPCITYTTTWRDPRTGEARPFSIRSPIYFVPETERSTWLHTFVYARAEGAVGAAWPLVRHVATLLARLEIGDDARFVPALRDTPYQHRGMRLGKFDKPLVASRQLLAAYFDGALPPAEEAPTAREEADVR
jgi:phenylpropionate dioxygenase-like ring-hydroxylating dioxygenase large terminal subunit